ncbi:MAG: hypothetical protein WKF79_15405 [Nocardioides sp.]
MSDLPPEQPQQPQPYGQQPPPQQPYPPGGYVQPGYGQPQPKQSHTARNILIAFAVIFVLLLGGCLAVGALFVNGVDNAIDEIEEADNEPGAVDNPLAIEEGKGFEVYGFDYADGWSVVADPIGDVDIKELKFTNNRDEADSAFVEIKFYAGSEIVASTDCTSDTVEPGTTVTLTCLSVDDLPKSYDKITINDTF